MQKKLIALAVAAAFSAPAFADVSMYGVVDATVARASADGQKSDIQVLSGGLSASRIGVKGAEDLNNGMKAVVVLEYGLDTEVNAGVGAQAGTSNGLVSGTGTTSMVARQQMLAVAGDFGTFATGYLQTAGYDWASKFDPMAGSAVSPLQVMTKGDAMLIGSATYAARAPRALAYISPDMNGLSFAVNYSTDTGLGSTVNKLVSPATPYNNASGLGNLAQGSSGTDMKIPAWLVAVNYGTGPLAVGGVYAKASMTAINADQADMALGGSYDFGVAKLLATYQNSKFTVGGTSSTDKAMSVSAVAPVGPGAVAFSYAKNTIDGCSTCGAKGMTVAWLQGLSKTTTFYAAVEKVSNNSGDRTYSVLNNALGGGIAAQGAAVPGNTAMTLGGSSTLLAVGLNKKF